MKLSLVVLSPGKTQGKVIAVARLPFVIGRDPDCHLRPANVLVSKRHCALTVRDAKAYLQDLNSTNGTSVNGRQVKGEIELVHEDRLNVGPLEFAVRIEGTVPVDAPTPLAPGSTAEEDAATALLRSEQPAGPGADGEVVPEGTTEVQFPPLAPAPAAPEAKGKAAKPPTGDTTEAAKKILDMYLRRRPG